MLIESADYEKMLEENSFLKTRLALIECNRDLGLFVRLLEKLRGFAPGEVVAIKDDLLPIFGELIARANEK